MTVVVHPRSRVRAPWGYVVLGKSSGAVARNSNNSTDTTYMTLGSVTIPGGTLEENSILRIWSAWGYTNSATAKNLVPRLGTNSLGQTAPTTTVYATLCNFIWNDNSLVAQRGGNTVQGMQATVNNAMLSMAYDTREDQIISFQCNWGTNIASETITLERWIVEAIL